MNDHRKTIKSSRRLVSAKEVQEEYLDIDIRTIRKFLNQYCSYKKIGRQYFYLRSDVERLLGDPEITYEFPLDD